MRNLYTSAAVSALALLGAGTAQAADFSFAGMLSDPNEVAFFDFSVGTTSTVTLRSYSYAGGTNAAGATIVGGGFDPVLTLYNLTTGQQIGNNDDGGCGTVPADPNTGRCYDVYLQSSLTAGSYRVGVSVFPNFPLGNLAAGYENDAGSFGDNRTAAFAFDVLNVDVATGPGAMVPEPSSWALMILGFGLVGGALRSRRTGALRHA